MLEVIYPANDILFQCLFPNIIFSGTQLHSELIGFLVQRLDILPNSSRVRARKQSNGIVICPVSGIHDERLSDPKKNI